MKEILKLDVNITGIESVSNAHKKIHMIGFNGKASGDYFTGEVLVNGVDTQFIEEGRLLFSARYLLEGYDNKGESCRIFIENNGPVDCLVPSIVTNSSALDFLNTAQLISTVEEVEGGVVVRIFQEERA